MPGRLVDVVTLGPPPRDPYEPSASAWGLAAAMANRGDDVRVLHLVASDSAPPPPGVASVPLGIPLRRPGGPVEPAELATAAGKRLRKGVEVVLRDPVGLGTLGLSRTRRSSPLVGAFAHALELSSFEDERHGRPPVGVVDRFDHWLDRRMVRRLERAALTEADRVFYDLPDVARGLSEQYTVPARKLVQLAPAVPSLASHPSREVSRKDLRIPLDVPVVAAPAAFGSSEPAGLDRVLDAFRRIRPFFPGVRLVVAGASVPADPGVVALPDRSSDTFADALASADLAVFARRVPGFDPGLVLAARAALPVVALPDARLAVDPGGGVRLSASDDAGDLASVLAELLADPATQKEVGRAAARFSEAFLPEKVAAKIDELVTPRAA